MNNATKVALGIIEEREKMGIRPAVVTWVEVYLKMGAHDINAEQMTRQLNDGVQKGYLLVSRGLNGQIYSKKH